MATVVESGWSRILRAIWAAFVRGATDVASAELTAFWCHLPDATVDGDLLRLARNTTFLGDVELGSVLYVRDDYRRMLQVLLQLFRDGIRKLVVSGNPGIGKSRFGLYLLHHIAAAFPRACVVWEASRSRERYLFRCSAVLHGGLDSFMDVLRDREAWYIVDEGLRDGPTQVKAKTVFLTSPKRENYNKFLNAPGATIRYMPMWTWDEIEACHRLIYAGDLSRPLSDVSSAYKRWGGVPRLVLEKLCDHAAQLELDKALARADLSKLEDAVGAIDAAEELSHRILHIVTEFPYTHTRIVLASAYVADQVVNQLAVRQAKQLESFLKCASSNPMVAGLRGTLFEAFAHRTLLAGGTFRVRSLDGCGETGELRLQRAQSVQLNRVSDLMAHATGTYCQPASRCFPAVDAVKLPQQLFQMTVSRSHNVSHAGLVTVLKQMPVAPNYDLYFVVPEDIYETFEEQPYVLASGARVVRLDARVQAVRQLVLCIPLRSGGIAEPAQRLTRRRRSDAGDSAPASGRPKRQCAK